MKIKLKIVIEEIVFCLACLLISLSIADNGFHTTKWFEGYWIWARMIVLWWLIIWGTLRRSKWVLVAGMIWLMVIFIFGPDGSGIWNW